MEKEIELINKIIYESVIHGGDSGGYYCSNFSNLEKSIQNWLIFKKLDKDYTIINKEKINNYEYNISPKIVKNFTNLF